jgi:hypothetical protein
MARLTVVVKLFHDGKKRKLDVVEYHPFEPSAYVWDSGWSCVDSKDSDEEYYVSEGGDVFLHGKSEVIGIAPAVKEMQLTAVPKSMKSAGKKRKRGKRSKSD